VERSSGEIVLFIGDDIVPAAPDYLAQHESWHRERHEEPHVAVLGYTTWDPAVRVTAFMRWLEERGPQFSYGELSHGQLTDYRHFYTSNISLRRSFLAEDRFDERFRYAAFEDAELGYRLGGRGLRIAYNRDAMAGHLHEIGLAGYMRRAYFAGRSAALFGEIHPEMVERFPRLFGPPRVGLAKRVLLNPLTVRVLTLLGRMAESKLVLPNLYATLYAYHHRRGLRAAYAEM
ncbi:MAG: hypothetical protein ACYTDY_20150, partial [Planctomycetota bacterium]|jgi:hypothetical protein